MSMQYHWVNDSQRGRAPAAADTHLGRVFRLETFQCILDKCIIIPWQAVPLHNTECIYHNETPLHLANMASELQQLIQAVAGLQIPKGCPSSQSCTSGQSLTCNMQIMYMTTQQLSVSGQDAG